MATQREGSKREGGLFASSAMSLNGGSGWGAAPSSAGEKKESNADTEPALEQEPQPRYLTTSGLFERPPRPSAWSEANGESTMATGAEAPKLVNDFRSALLRPKDDDDIRLSKNRKTILALAVAGILLVATAATIYRYHPRNSAAELQTAKTWMGKQLTSDLQEISKVFHVQAVGPENTEPNRQRDLSTFLQERRSTNLDIPVAPERVQETQPTENLTSFDLYVTDSSGRRWIFTPTGHEFGPVNDFGDPSASEAVVRPTVPEECQSPFYRLGCP
jgi:hypothetical protein